MKPIVDGLEKQYAGKLVVIRVNIQSAAGQSLASRYGFQYTPTFIFFDATGNELWREVGQLDVVKVEQALK
jgi:cytochrome c-type biogenesis protein